MAEDIQKLLRRIPPEHLEVIKGFINCDPAANYKIIQTRSFFRDHLGLTEEEFLSVVRYFSEKKK